MMHLDREQLRDALLEHQRLGPASCTCGARLPFGSSFADHVLAQLEDEPTHLEVLGREVLVE